MIYILNYIKMYKTWNIILVKFPFTDLSDFKLRPALIIWEYKNDFIILAISSKKNNWINQEIKKADLSKWELLIKSYIKINKITSIEKSIIYSKIWSVEKKFLKKIKGRFVEEVL